jgi:glutathione peroxidase
LTSDNYTQLVDLYKQYKDQGLQILGFPCGQFMNQELSTDGEVKDFVQKKFEVEFPMFSKIEVNGPHTHEIFKYLKYNSVQMNSEKGLKNIPWNFAKFLVDIKGNVQGFYEPKVKPADMVKYIEPMLGIKSEREN